MYNIYILDISIYIINNIVEYKVFRTKDTDYRVKSRCIGSFFFWKTKGSVCTVAILMQQKQSFWFLNLMRQCVQSCNPAIITPLYMNGKHMGHDARIASTWHFLIPTFCVSCRSIK